MRRILLDANVFDQIARGNVEAADTLRRLVREHDVYKSWHAFQEWVIVTANRKQANTVISIIEKLKIKNAPPAPSAVLNELKAKNVITNSKGNASILAEKTDLRVAAEAKALDAEIWSFDRAFRKNAGAVEKTLGVKVAAETKALQPVAGRPKAKQSRALRLLGINDDPVEAHLPGGKVTSSAAAPAGEGAAVKEGESLAVNEGEKLAVNEGVEAEPEGGGVEPQGEGMAPGAGGKGATTSAVEGGAMAGEQKGIEKLEHAEDEKAQEGFKRYEPTVRRLTAAGNWVLVKSWFDAPRAPNLLASVYKERSDVGEFLYTTIQSGATRDEARRDTPSQLKQVDYGISEAPPPKATSKDRKAVAREVREFEPDPPGEPLNSTYADFIGTYHPANLDQEAGEITPLRRQGWHRELKLRAGSSADPSSVVQMWTLDDKGEKSEWQTVWVSGNDPVKGISALFTRRAPNGTALCSIQSEIHYMYTPGGDRVFEHAKGSGGEDPSPKENWSAVFTWARTNQSK